MFPSPTSWLSRLVTVSGAASLCACLASFEPLTPPVEPPVPQEVPRVLALAGADLEVLEGSQVILDGHGSRALEAGASARLSWSQVITESDGPSVLLSNPSSPAPIFVAPAGPAELTFQLRASVGDAEALDQVSVKVVRGGPRPPLFVEGPADLSVIPGEIVEFSVAAVGVDADALTVRARPFCDSAETPVVVGTQVSFVAPDALPCAILIDADIDGRRTSTVARVLWPTGVSGPGELNVEQPFLVEPGQAFALGLSTELGQPSLRAWPAGGVDTALTEAVSGAIVPVTAPQTAGRAFFGVEGRIGTVSSGVRIVAVDIGEGAGNRAPIASGGADRKVPPGGVFRIDTLASRDPDDDPLTIQVDQVLGALAERAEGQDTFTAPLSPGVLIFHVTARDAVVFSSPVSVRVDVIDELDNLAPLVDVVTERFVTPGGEFELSLASANDPDSGFIERFRISQSPEDPVVLLAAPVEAREVTLTAGAPGDVYRFTLAAFDAFGLQGSAEVTVTVELAGPYVDFSRGFADGDGTPSRPFLNLADAIVVAERHQLPELRLGAGPQLPVAAELPSGLSLSGGWEFVDNDWVEGAGRTELRVAAGGLGLNNGALLDIDLVLDAPDAALRLAGAATLADCSVSEGPLHQGAMVSTLAAATAELTRVVVAGAAPSTSAVLSPAVAVTAGSSLRLDATTVSAGSGGRRAGIACAGGVLDVFNSEVGGGVQADETVGLVADACDVQVLASTLRSGSGAVTRGLDARRTPLVVDAASSLEVDAGDDAVGLLYESVAASGAVTGAIRVGATTRPVSGVGAIVRSARLQLNDLSVLVRATDDARGLVVERDEVVARNLVIDASATSSATAVVLDGADDVVLDGLEVVVNAAVAVAVELGDASGAQLERFLASVTGSVSGTGVDGRSAFAPVIDGGDIAIAAPVATGVIVRGGSLSDVRATVDGVDGVACSMTDATGSLSLTRTRLIAQGTNSAAGAVVDGALVAHALLARVEAPVGVAVEVRGLAEIIHGTLLSTDVALRAGGSSAALDVVNTAFSGQIGWEATPGAPSFAGGRALAFEGPVLVRDEAGDVVDEAALSGLGCVSCLRAAVTELLDDDGILIDGDNALVDVGDPARSLDFDLDDGERPLGIAPDIGADER